MFFRSLVKFNGSSDDELDDDEDEDKAPALMNDVLLLLDVSLSDIVKLTKFLVLYYIIL
jgi:hypothetical protein